MIRLKNNLLSVPMIRIVSINLWTLFSALLGPYVRGNPGPVELRHVRVKFSRSAVNFMFFYLLRAIWPEQ